MNKENGSPRMRHALVVRTLFLTYRTLGSPLGSTSIAGKGWLTWMFLRAPGTREVVGADEGAGCTGLFAAARR